MCGRFVMHVTHRKQITDWLNSAMGCYECKTFGGVSLTFRITNIAGLSWRTGRMTLPDGRRFRMAWSEDSDEVVVGDQLTYRGQT